MKVARSDTPQPSPLGVPPPRDADYGVVPWDQPETAGMEAARQKLIAMPPPPPAAVSPGDVKAFGVRLSGRAAGFVDAAYELGRTAREHPVITVLAIGGVVALELLCPPAMLVVAGGLAAVGGYGVGQAEAHARFDATPEARESARRDSGRNLFLTLTAVPLRGRAASR